MYAILSDCGFQTEPHLCLIARNSFTFVRNLDALFCQDAQKLDEFLEEFRKVCLSNDRRLVAFLTATDGENNEEVKNDSLIKMLLECRHLQHQVLEILLNVIGKC